VETSDEEDSSDDDDDDDDAAAGTNRWAPNPDVQMSGTY
jgi:hypothetical protein